ncbi:type II secretion system protein GspJ [Stutzerimonas stutzeri]|uniref:type II secretion system protein GspJ n=1 Tax=Stutzerimonas stutzeri TaxID=316 RepID=UPI00210D2203|nr:type II secretion system protein GspJ [Stutzerimonas stutzeri]MCQ4322521.1 type II secretion system protein GspJ [Stutzerimonas stutzeri]
MSTLLLVRLLLQLLRRGQSCHFSGAAFSDALWRRVAYRCDRGRLFRSVSNNLDGSDGSEALVVDSLSGCTFSYVPGSNTRNGLVTLRLSLSKEGETITLVQQVHVDNAP